MKQVGFGIVLAVFVMTIIGAIRLGTLVVDLEHAQSRIESLEAYRKWSGRTAPFFFAQDKDNPKNSAGLYLWRQRYGGSQWPIVQLMNGNERAANFSIFVDDDGAITMQLMKDGDVQFVDLWKWAEDNPASEYHEDPWPYRKQDLEAEEDISPAEVDLEGKPIE